MFVIYESSGMIQATVGGPGLEYGTDILDKEGKLWLFLEGATSLDPRANHVDVVTKTIVPNHAVELVASKTTITDDSTIISGIPEGAAVNLYHDGTWFAGEVVNGGVVELTASSPGTYKIEVSCQNYNPAAIEITAQ